MHPKRKNKRNLKYKLKEIAVISPNCYILDYKKYCGQL